MVICAYLSIVWKHAHISCDCLLISTDQTNVFDHVNESLGSNLLCIWSTSVFPRKSSTVKANGSLCMKSGALLYFRGGFPTAVYSGFYVREFLKTHFPAEQFIGTPSGESDWGCRGNDVTWIRARELSFFYLNHTRKFGMWD